MKKPRVVTKPEWEPTAKQRATMLRMHHAGNGYRAIAKALDPKGRLGITNQHVRRKLNRWALEKSPPAPHPDQVGRVLGDPRAQQPRRNPHAIIIGKRHRTDLGDIDGLAREIDEVGL